MNARRVMRHRCTIERNTASSDNHGGKRRGTWTPHATGIPCCAYHKTGMLQQQPAQTQAVEEIELILPVGTDINTSTDRLGDITDRLGNLLIAGPLTIQGPVERRANHLSLTLRKVT